MAAGLASAPLPSNMAAATRPRAEGERRPPPTPLRSRRESKDDDPDHRAAAALVRVAVSKAMRTHLADVRAAARLDA
eukprot:7378011-Prymnesium_polylepis.1